MCLDTTNQIKVLFIQICVALYKTYFCLLNVNHMYRINSILILNYSYKYLLPYSQKQAPCNLNSLSSGQYYEAGSLVRKVTLKVNSDFSVLQSYVTKLLLGCITMVTCPAQQATPDEVIFKIGVYKWTGCWPITSPQNDIIHINIR